MNPAVEVRRAVEADIPRILEIERESGAAAHFAEADYRLAVASDANPVLRVVLVAEASGSVHGFLVARFLHREWEIENLAVAISARKAGFGARLVNAFLQSNDNSINGSKFDNAEAESVFLEVRESNLAARNLYEKSGFAIVGRRQAYYHNPEENAILYRYSFQ